MTGVLNVDTIADNAGTGPVTLTKQEANKAWYMLDGTGTISLRDSFNIASTTDDGIGIYSVTFTNNMGAATYGISQASSYALNNFVGNTSAPCNTYATTGFATENTNTTHGAYLDYAYVSSSVNGDLA